MNILFLSSVSFCSLIIILAGINTPKNLKNDEENTATSKHSVSLLLLHNIMLERITDILSKM